MPLYEFVCQSCKDCFEVLVSASESEQPPCPRCHSQEVERVLSSVSIGRSKPDNPAGLSDCAGCPGRGASGGCPMD